MTPGRGVSVAQANSATKAAALISPRQNEK
jgi:hypothetical protein